VIGFSELDEVKRDKVEEGWRKWDKGYVLNYWNCYLGSRA
jgi:hypothetical protein